MFSVPLDKYYYKHFVQKINPNFVKEYGLLDVIVCVF